VALQYPGILFSVWAYSAELVHWIAANVPRENNQYKTMSYVL